MRYVMTRYKQSQREVAYRIYITDALRSISENTAKYGGGSYIQSRFADIIHPRPEDNRTQAEIVEHIRGKLRKL